MTRPLYSCHPILNYGIGRFQFVNTILDFNAEGCTDEDVKEFEKLHQSLPPVDQARIKLLDVSVAEELVARVLASQTRTTQVIDSSNGANPDQIGEGKLEDSNPSEEAASMTVNPTTAEVQQRLGMLKKPT